MKITARDEYGLRILLRIASCEDADGISIPQLSEAEGITSHNVAKFARILRIGGLIKSTRGHTGGYTMAKTPADITINDILKVMGGRFFDEKFCPSHTGILKHCRNSIDCSIRSLWVIVQVTLDKLLDSVTLQDLLGNEKKSVCLIEDIVNQKAGELLKISKRLVKPRKA